MVIAVPTVLVIFDFAGFVICLHGSSHHASAAFAHMSVDVLEPILFFCEAFTNLFCAGQFLSNTLLESMTLKPFSSHHTFAIRHWDMPEV
jgi:hypothetical protein